MKNTSLEEKTDLQLADKLDEIYTPVENIKAEVKRRWDDKKLQVQVEDYLRGNLPIVLRKEPRAMFTRQVTSPNEEFFCFHQLALELGIKPLGWEFCDDSFVTTNWEKAYLGRLGLLQGLDKNNSPKICYKKVIDLTGKEEGKKINEINTLWGENLVEFHHRLLKESFPDLEVYDASVWYRLMGLNAGEYYPFFLALFLRNGVLFENFSICGFEKKFTENILIPSFKKVHEMFGIKPLISRIVSKERTEDRMVGFYKSSLVHFDN